MDRYMAKGDDDSKKTPEASIQRDIRLDIGARDDVVLFRNNTGALEDVTGRLVRYGLCDGSSDLIGIVRLPNKIGAFLAIEVKATGARTPRHRRERQDAFLALVVKLGGISGYARSVEDARRIVDDGISRLSKLSQLSLQKASRPQE